LSNVYGYINFIPSPPLSLTVGLGAESFKQGTQNIDTSLFTPKLGVLWSLNRDTVVRAAAFRSLKKAAVAEVGIEPTQVGGFSRVLDDWPATVATCYGIALDHKLATNFLIGFEYFKRNLSVPVPTKGSQEPWYETTGQTYLHWLPSNDLVLSSGYQVEGFDRNNFDATNKFSRFKTYTLRLGTSYFGLEATALRLAARRIRQSGEFGPPNHGYSAFWLVDASAEYRLPNRWACSYFR
jgi:TonB dependent receptor